MAKVLRIYADTSVFGGCLDDEFAVDSKAMFREISSGKFLLLVSIVLLRELTLAPDEVQKILADLPEGAVEMIPDTDEIPALRDAYIHSGILGEGSKADAEHIAAASVGGADILVSWNFRHIVHFEKIAGFQAVNMLRGYNPIRIFSPKEVV